MTKTPQRSREGVREHWQDWAVRHGSTVKATTRTATAKVLEIAALIRTINAIIAERPVHRILEAGCGNGQNCIALAKAFPDIQFSAFDFIPEMISAAVAAAEAEHIRPEQISFFQGDVTDWQVTADKFDIVLSVRCLINLSTPQEQFAAISGLASHLVANGTLLLIENSNATYSLQNDFREAVGLPRRHPADFNLFFDEPALLKHLHSLGLSVECRDFSSLHDILLYVLVPMINGGSVDYSHPIVQAATDLSVAVGSSSEAIGSAGQNRLFICKR